MARLFFAALIAAVSLPPLPAPAAEIEGLKLAERAQVGETDLVLNGAGLRQRLVFKVYVGALYLRQKSTNARDVLADAGAKRIVLHLLRELTAEQFSTALKSGLAENHTAEDMAKMEAQWRQLEDIFAVVKVARPGDVILLDYLPGAGSRVVVNGDAKGTIPGGDFYRALLRIWIGDKPADAVLKKALLGA